jgi:hypothetical protein
VTAGSQDIACQTLQIFANLVFTKNEKKFILFLEFFL